MLEETDLQGQVEAGDCQNKLGGLICGRPESHEVHLPLADMTWGHEYEPPVPSSGAGAVGFARRGRCH